MAFNPENYFDIWNILVYEVIGGIDLAIALGLILIAYFSARYMIPFQVGIAMMILYLVIIVAITGNLTFWTIVVLIIGLLFYWIISRVMRRG